MRSYGRSRRRAITTRWSVAPSRRASSSSAKRRTEHEFYRERAEITKRLITEQGFTAVAVEGDWPDAYRVNRYVRGASEDRDSEEALREFRRFPAWM